MFKHTSSARSSKLLSHSEHLTTVNFIISEILYKSGMRDEKIEKGEHKIAFVETKTSYNSGSKSQKSVFKNWMIAIMVNNKKLIFFFLVGRP
jgi:hypothetical protein